MDEFAFIQSIKQAYYKQPSVVKGIGDDAAIIRQPYQDIITTVDTMVESIHFSTETTEPYHIGFRALAANISDIAAMGGIPSSYLVSMTIPNHWSQESLQAIYAGMDGLAKQYQMDVIGGDTVSGEQLTVTITVIGYVPKGKARYRSQAREGDIVFVTGTLGDSACGLHMLLKGVKDISQEDQYFIERHRMPVPRVSFAKACQSLNRIVFNDVSDGIANEANEIAEASQLTLQLNYNDIPVHAYLRQFEENQVMEWALSGGEDFELIGTVSPNEWGQLKKIANQTDTMLTAIGTVLNKPKQNGMVLLEKKSRIATLEKSGYTHLRGEKNE
ncbi:thiamine-phosphate kinase [Gracilibacillus sp. YIM 98692]|uniref:thiamine-phosphate kinase n=1 Tax=Gracilibacillus sp. YIM 98692 TaxID=2663532 RepID=UPI0013D560B3|nr:thiamine-phosphate kinase [Gracilibacillus sp. YIM 98692]